MRCKLSGRTHLSTIRCVSLAIVLGAFAPARGQAPAGAPEPTRPLRGPAWVVEQFYARRSFPQLGEYVTGEFAKHYRDAGSLGAHLPAGVIVTSRILRQDDTSSIFATTIRDSVQARDWYTFLRHEDARWKISAVRTLVMPAIHYEILDAMRARFRARSLIDTLVPVMQRMALAVAPDAALADYARENRKALVALAQRARQYPGLHGVSVDGQVGPAGSISPTELGVLVDVMRPLNVGAIEMHSEYPNCTFLKIGGDEDNYVGFLYAPSGCSLPPITPDLFIYIEKAAPDLYVYKTT